jgi:hypothetical protein
MLGIRPLGDAGHIRSLPESLVFFAFGRKKLHDRERLNPLRSHSQRGPEKKVKKITIMGFVGGVLPMCTDFERGEQAGAPDDGLAEGENG